MARTHVSLPALGEGVSEGTLARWLVSPGDRVQRYQPLVEIETDKVDAELPSPAAGVVAEILVPAGGRVAPGTPICVIADEPATAGEPAPPPGPASPAAAAAPPGPAAAVPPASAPAPAPSGHGPAVRLLAARHGVDLAEVAGSGAGGRVTPEDVLRLVQARAEAPAGPGPEPEAAPAAAGGPRPGMRRRVAERLSRSWREAPHAWMRVECDVTGLVALRAAEREGFRSREGRDLSYLPFFARAAVAGLRAQPAMNATWGPDGVRQQHGVHLGVAVALEDGLVVPVLREADGMSLAGLARALAALVARARSGRLLTEDLEGGTFTINNVGSLGSVASAPIINPPQAGILTLEAIGPRVVAMGEGIAIRQRVNLCLSFDHRVADGLVAARFLQTVRGVLEAYRPGDALY
jgi:2-oxoisovalerate dehydrogenase E2 component (dihydrolipoyl transacylase)